MRKLKSGFLLHYQKRIFGKDWRSVFCILYDDSNFAWYKDQSSPVAEEKICLKDAPHLLAVGQHTAMVPKKPKLPPSTSLNHLLAMGTQKKDNIYWFMFADDNDLNAWMSAIVSTLPPPPSQQTPPNSETCKTNNGNLGAPPPPTFSSSVGPTIEPAPSYGAPPPYQQYHQMYGQPAPGNTTVIVDRSRGDTGDFATGMLMGGAMGMALGSTSHWGWGGGWGCGGGWGGHDDIHIDNHINVYNDYDIVNSTSITNDYSSASFDGGDFGGGDFDCDGFDF